VASLNTSQANASHGVAIGIIGSYQQVQVIFHQTHRIQSVWQLGLCFGEQCKQHIPSQPLSKQKLTAVTPQRDIKGIILRDAAWGTRHLMRAFGLTVLHYSLASWHIPVGFD